MHASLVYNNKSAALDNLAPYRIEDVQEDLRPLERNLAREESQRRLSREFYRRFNAPGNRSASRRSSQLRP